MNKLTNALLLKEESPRLNIALVYGIVGIVVGALVLGSSNE